MKFGFQLDIIIDHGQILEVLASTITPHYYVTKLSKKS